MNFDIIGLIYILILVIFILIGLKKGFFSSLVLIIKMAISITISSLFSRPLALLFLKSGIGQGWSESIGKTLENVNPFFSQIYAERFNDEAFEILNIPQNIRYLFTKLIGKEYIVTPSATIGTVFGRGITYYSLIVIMFIVSFIILMILTSLLKGLFASIKENQFGNYLDTLLGAIFFGAVGLVFIAFASYGISLLVAQNNDFSSWLVTTMRLDTNDFTISKFVYNYNLMGYITGFFQAIFNV